MNSKIVSTKFNAIFLAAILVAGTITAVYPSFVIGAEAQSETLYGVDSYKQPNGKDSYKSKDSSSAIVKKVKCNNIDVNVNGLEITALPPSLSGLLTDEAQATDEGERGASSYGSGEGSYGSGGQSGYDNKNSFKFVCINNNNNTVIGGEEEPEVPEPTITCEECFTEILNATELEQFLEEAFIPTATIEQDCIVLSSGLVAEEDLRDVLEFVLSEQDERIDDIIECLIEAGIEFDPEENELNEQGVGLDTQGGIFNVQ